MVPRNKHYQKFVDWFISFCKKVRDDRKTLLLWQINDLLMNDGNLRTELTKDYTTISKNVYLHMRLN